jgi:putative ABC transport system substrate-binding protein
MTAPDQCCTNLKKLMLKIPQCGASCGRSVLLGILGAIPRTIQVCPKDRGVRPMLGWASQTGCTAGKTMSGIKRREFITLLGGAAAAWPVTARAQRDRLARIAVWIGAPQTDSQGQRRATALQEALRDLGWIEGRNIAIEYHWAVIDGEQVRAETAELVARNPDVIVTTGAPTLAAAHKATSTIPIVFALVTDPVSDGFVASLARPGGNITGFTIFEHSFAGKWLEMLKEAAPVISRVAVMQNPDHPAWEGYLRAIGTVASPLGVEVTPAPVHNAAEIEHALEAFARIPNVGLILLPSGVAINHHELIARLAARYGIPSISARRTLRARPRQMA